MEPDQVKDTAGTAVAAGPLGQFNVAVTMSLSLYSANMDTDPGWTLQPSWEFGTPNYGGSGPSGGYTGTKILGFNLSGNYANGLSTKYATTPVIDTTGSAALTLRFKRWLRTHSNDPVSIDVSTDGVSWLSIWTTSAQVSDSSWQSMEYPLPASVVGSSTLRLRWGLSSNQTKNDIGWNIDDVELTGTGTFDANPPQANLTVTNLSSEGVQNHPCAVTYSDAVAVRRASLDSSDLLVTGPNGYSKLASFAGADLPIDGSPITGSYSIPAPDGIAWTATHNGVYTITLQQSEVEDTFGNGTTAATLGTFTVNLIPATPGTMDVIGSDSLTASGTVGGPFTPGSITYTLTNPGGTAIGWTATKTASWLDLSPTSGNLAAGASTTVTVTINSGADVLTAATYTDTLAFTNKTNGSGNTTRAVSLTAVSPGELVVDSSGDLAASGTVGGPFSSGSVIYTLSNSGGTAIDWTATNNSSWLDFSPTAGSLAAGASTTVTVALTSEATTLVAGTYDTTLNFGFTISGGGTGGGGQPASTGGMVTREAILDILENIKVIGHQFSEAGTFEIIIQGSPNSQVTLEGTTDFIKWTKITSGQTESDGTVTLGDPDCASYPTRFYRASVSSP